VAKKGDRRVPRRGRINTEDTEGAENTECTEKRGRKGRAGLFVEAAQDQLESRIHD